MPQSYMPSWYVQPHEQVAQVTRFLNSREKVSRGFTPLDIPDLPRFTPRSPTEVRLLTVMLPRLSNTPGLTRSFRAWWTAITPAAPVMRKLRGDQARSNPGNLRLAMLDYEPGIRWVAFDPFANLGDSPTKARMLADHDGLDLAHVHVLIAVALFPRLIAAINEDGTGLGINLSGLSAACGARWSGVPYLAYDRGTCTMVLDVHPGGEKVAGWSSPTFRDLY